MHLSNSLPDIRIAPYKNAFEERMLVIGRFVTLNQIQTTAGWMYFGGLIVFLLAIQLFMIGKEVLKQRKHLRALDEVKKM